MLAFTFPGQGSQKPGMGAAWESHPSWELVPIASEATGRDVAHLLLDADQAELTETRNAQLATFVLSLVIFDAIERIDIRPDLVAGHSLGEYTALVASGAISFEEGCRIVSARGEAMGQAAEDQPGTMYAILGLADEQVDVACRRADGDAWVANYNAPGQVVIAGAPDALARAASIAKQLGAKRAVALPVGGAFHTPYMAPARDHLRKALVAARFGDPEIAIVANVDAMAHSVGADWPELCSAQLCSPVRWRHSVSTLLDLGATSLVEVGPGNVLGGLARRIAPDTRAMSVADPADVDKLVEFVDTRTSMLQLAEHRLAEPTEGEHLFVDERLVVSTTNGLFAALGPDTGTPIGGTLKVGAAVGRVGETDICTPFAGKLMGFMVIEGERISVGQPIAWLRSNGA